MQPSVQVVPSAVDAYEPHIIPGTKTTMPRFTGAKHDLVPDIDPHYFFRPELVEQVAFAVETNQNTLLVGQAGTGKSSLIEQLAAQLNQPLRNVNLHGESDTTMFVGRDVPIEIDGKRTLRYAPGVLTQALQQGYWLILNEIDAALQPILFVLQGVLEDNGRLVLDDAKGTVVRKHPSFRIFATANTIGIASRYRALYSGTMTRMNEATLDRFACVVYVTDLPLEQEIAMIQAKVPDCDPLFVQGICRIAKQVREQIQKESITCTFSTRRCLQWARATVRFHPLEAAKLTVLNKLSPDDYQAIAGVLQRAFGQPVK